MQRILAVDFIHLIYNLAYPGFLGSFLYELVLSGKKFGLWGWAGRGAVLLIFSLDFMWGKKFYEQSMSGSLSVGQLWTCVFLEAFILAALCRAFNASPRNSDHGRPVVFVVSILMLIIAVLTMFGVVSPGPMFGERSVWVLCGFLVLSILSLVIERRFGEGWGFKTCVVFACLLTVIYYVVSVKDGSWQRTLMKPSGSIF